ncbi:MAG: DUF1343 domain-containing protein [Gemmatimonadota bacterium]|nr:DUF1343 domain-containing protein [Gemmatimonadota bacterium]
MRPSRTSFAAILIAALATVTPACTQTHVRLGVDRLADGLPKILAGKRVGLITNHTGRDRAADAMTARHLPGVQFVAVDFAVLPTARKYAGQTKHGVRMVVTDRETYRPISTTLRLIDTIRRLQPNEFKWRHSTASPTSPETYYFDTLTGSKRTRAAIEHGTLETLLAEWDRDEQRFFEMRKPYLLY